MLSYAECVAQLFVEEQQSGGVGAGFALLLVVEYLVHHYLVVRQCGFGQGAVEVLRYDFLVTVAVQPRIRDIAVAGA